MWRVWCLLPLPCCSAKVLETFTNGLVINRWSHVINVIRPTQFSFHLPPWSFTLLACHSREIEHSHLARNWLRQSENLSRDSTLGDCSYHVVTAPPGTEDTPRLHAQKRLDAVTRVSVALARRTRSPLHMATLRPAFTLGAFVSKSDVVKIQILVWNYAVSASQWRGSGEHRQEIVHKSSRRVLKTHICGSVHIEH